MRIFVFSTGRCGSVTFKKACEHITNYTVEHEGMYAHPLDLEFPDNHIEISPMLYHAMPMLAGKYPDAMFIHLIRDDRAAFCRSYARLKSVIGDYPIEVWARIYSGGGRDREEIAGYFYDCVNGFLAQSGPDFTVHLEKAADEWLQFLDIIGAEGDFEASCEEWGVKHNSGEERKEV